MAIQYSNQYAGLRSAGTRGDYRVQRTPVDGILSSVADSRPYVAAVTAASQSRAMQNAALMRASTDLAVGGANAVSNLAAATMAAAGQVGATGVRAAGDVAATRISADAAIEDARNRRLMQGVGLAGTLGVGAWALSQPQEPFPTYRAPAPVSVA